MEMDSKLLLSDLRAQDVDGATHHPIKIENADIDDVALPQQKLKELSVVRANSSETFDVECSDEAQKFTVECSGSNITDVISDSDLDEEAVSVGVAVTTVESIDQGMIDSKPDPPLSIFDEGLNASSCSIDIVEGNVDRLASSDIDATPIDDKAAPDPPEFSNVLFDADSSIVRLHHDERVDDTTETASTLMKEVDPPEYSNVIFDADASIVRLHFEQDQEVAETTEKEVDPPEYSNVIFDADASIVRLQYGQDEEVKDTTEKKQREPDPPESTNFVFSYDSSSDTLQMEQEPEAPIAEGNEAITETTQEDESDTQKFLSDLPRNTKLPSIDEAGAEVNGPILPVTDTLNSSAITEETAATAVDQMEVACPELIDTAKLIEGECGGVELSSDVDVEHNLEALPIQAIAETNVTVSSSAPNSRYVTHDEKKSYDTTDTSLSSETKVCTDVVNVYRGEVSNIAASSSDEKEKAHVTADTSLPSETKVCTDAVNIYRGEVCNIAASSSDEKEKAHVTADTSLPSESNVRPETVIINQGAPAIDKEVSSYNDLVNTPEEKTGSNMVPTADSSGKHDAKEVGVSEGSSAQFSQSSFATFDDDDCSYEEIIVDDDDEFIEYVDEILEDDFTEETCESENGAEATFNASNNASFNGNLSNMDDLVCKRPVIKSATQKALENEVAMKTAAAEEVMQNMRFKLARQNSFCRKDDEYRKQLEMEEAEHLHLEELEETKRVTDQARQALSEKANPSLAQSEEDEFRRQEMEAAQEKAAAEKLRREVEEREKMERKAKREAMEEEVRLLQAKLAEAKIAAEQAKKKETEEKMRLKAKVDAHRREKRRTSIADAAQGVVETASTTTAESSTVTVSHAEPIASMPVMPESVPPPTSATPVNTNTVYYPVDALRQQSIPGLDYKNREIYIHPDEFQKLFQMSIAEFNEQPKWKRTNIKRKLKLF